MISGHCARRENHRARPRLVSRTIHKISHPARVSSSVRLSPSIASRSPPPPSRSASLSRAPSSLASSFTRTVTDAFTARIFAYSSAFVTTPPAPCGTACVHTPRVRQSMHAFRHHHVIARARHRVRSSTDAPRTRARAPSPVSLCSRFVSRIVSRSSPRRASRLQGESSDEGISAHGGLASPGRRGTGRRRGREKRRERGSRGGRRKRWWCYDACGRGVKRGERGRREVWMWTRRGNRRRRRARARRRRRRARGRGARIRRRGR